jgi:hypothetical protein
MTFADFGIFIPPDASGQFYMTCPKCSHTRTKSRAKCLSVNVDEGLWNCHHPGCDFRGTVKSAQSKLRIPIQIGHPFRRKSATCSEANRPRLRSKSATPGVA